MRMKDQDRLQHDLESVMRRIVALQQKRFYLAENSTPEEAVNSGKEHLRSLERIMHIHQALKDLVSRTSDLRLAQHRHDENKYGRSSRSFLAQATKSKPANYQTTAEKDEARTATEKAILEQLEEFALKSATDSSDADRQRLRWQKEQRTMRNRNLKATTSTAIRSGYHGKKRALLSDEDVHKIRARRKQGGPGSGVETLAVEFGVSPSWVYQILKGTASAYQHLNLTFLK